MTVNARHIALDMVGNILDKGAYANLEAYRNHSLAKLTDADRRFALEITYGTTKHRNTLDWVLEQFMSRPMEKTEPVVRNVLRTGAYQLLYMDRVPPSAVCNEAVELVKKRSHKGAAGFVNGVLRSVARKYGSLEDIRFPDIDSEPVDHISLKYSHPSWMVRRWLDNFGLDSTLAICRYDNKPPCLTVRVNTLRISPEDFTSCLEEKKIPWLPGEMCPESIIIGDFAKLEKDDECHGLYLAQSEPSMLVSRILAPEEGDRVLDACAAPGSKTTHIAQLMGDNGKILAVDIHRHRLELIENTCSRLGIGSVDTLLCDARELKVNEKFDRILVDAPCTGTGVLNRRADARWRREPEDVAAMSCLQKEILDNVADLLKPGGRLVYSTCSLEPEENIHVVDFILDKHREFLGEPFSESFSSLGIGKDSFTLQIAPYTYGTDGFFISCMVKS